MFSDQNFMPSAGKEIANKTATSKNFFLICANVPKKKLGIFFRITLTTVKSMIVSELYDSHG